MNSSDLLLNHNPTRAKLGLVVSGACAPTDLVKTLQQRYIFVAVDQADVIIVVGGDGFILKTLRQMAGYKKPFYGINGGTIGFLMNTYHSQHDLHQIVNQAVSTILHPLRVEFVNKEKKIDVLQAINEVVIVRSSAQACKLSISVNNTLRLPQLIGDGILVSTPAGSTGYNLSAHGPIIPLDANLLALTPLNVYAPRRWHGALLNYDVKITIDVLEQQFRPVYMTADDQQIEQVEKATIMLDRDQSYSLLFDPQHHLEERIIREQFLSN